VVLGLKQFQRVAMMDLQKSIRLAVDTGSVVLGMRRCKKLALSGKSKLVIFSGNCPLEDKQELEHACSLSGIRAMEFKGTSVELGTVCGKPFSVSALSVLEAGNSDILSEVK
jgi:large subunit ribosomal protein L30e